jgi:hypothetical protein
MLDCYVVHGAGLHEGVIKMPTVSTTRLVTRGTARELRFKD